FEYSLAIDLLRQSLASEYSKDDEEFMEKQMRLSSVSFMIPKSKSWEPELRKSTRYVLARAYQKAGESLKAQEILVKLNKESKGGLPVYALSQMAGQVQVSTPKKSLENQIKASEKENKSSYDYWLGRASYYTGRKDYKSADHAFEKALSLTAPGSKPEASTLNERQMVVSSFERYLWNQGKEDEAISFLFKEFDSIPDVEFRRRLIYLIWHHDSPKKRYVSAEDGRLWKLLSDSRDWGFTEEKILWRMLENASADTRDQYWAKAENLARSKGAEPAREQPLGWIMTRMGESQRAIPLLEDASKRIQDKHKRGSATFALFEAYLDTRNWRKAESVWPEVAAYLSASEISDWAGRLSLCTARAGAHKDALRLWKKKDEIDRTDLRHLDELANSGFKADLTGYYRSLALKSKDSTYADKALEILRGPN
ncbi:MAG: hypothetical protein K8F91_09355, partial [Candidatus Obscuribacterales bacterium]|nr:hypothetical protein [Candidatus Obscuribacterales bacterium]